MRPATKHTADTARQLDAREWLLNETGDLEIRKLLIHFRSAEAAGKHNRHTDAELRNPLDNVLTAHSRHDQIENDQGNLTPRFAHKDAYCLFSAIGQANREAAI